MRSDNGGTREYVLGHSEDELIRLERQAEIFAEPTEQLLRRAGIGRGMRVLDIGCGVGDVAMAAARLVGPGGSVLGIDRAGEALGTAAKRAERAGLTWLGFQPSDLHEFQATERFDAVTGRFILMYMTDPAAAIKLLSRNLRPGGVLAFAELDIDAAGSAPELPLLKQIIYWTTETYRRAGIEPNMGAKLCAAFHAAGLHATLAGTTRIENGDDTVVYDFAAGIIRTLLPSMVQFGIATEAEVGLDTLADRLRKDGTAAPHCFFLPRLVGAYARLPS